MTDSPDDLAGSAPPSGTLPAHSAQTDVMVPVTAEDVAREKRRRILKWGGILAAVALTGGLLYKRSVDPLHAQESYDAGVRFLESARYPAAILSFDRAIDLKSDFVQAYLMRGKASVANGQLSQAIVDFTGVLKLQPRSTQALLERGAVNLELKKFQLAADDAGQAIGIDPKLAAAYNLRGMALRSMGSASQALADFNRAVELAPNDDNYFQRGVTYQGLGRHNLAIADFDQVIQFRPDGASAYFARAESRRAIGDLPGARKDHEQGRILDGR